MQGNYLRSDTTDRALRALQRHGPLTVEQLSQLLGTCNRTTQTLLKRLDVSVQKRGGSMGHLYSISGNEQ
jgi:hypothetical protein